MIAYQQKNPPASRGFDFLKYTLLQCNRNNVGVLSIIRAVLELKFSIDLGKKRIVFADANVAAGMNLRSALFDDYVACLDNLSAVALNASALAVAISSVLG
jgi:hypothetical protein